MAIKHRVFCIHLLAVALHYHSCPPEVTNSLPDDEVSVGMGFEGFPEEQPVCFVPGLQAQDLCGWQGHTPVSQMNFVSSQQCLGIIDLPLLPDACRLMVVIVVQPVALSTIV